MKSITGTGKRQILSNGTEAILQKLEANAGQWVSALDLSHIAIEYKRPIWQLRHQQGLTIENRVTLVGGKRHGYYRLVRETSGQSQAALLEIAMPARKYLDPEAQR